MSQLQITNAGIDYRNAVFAGDEVQNITHFVFANIPGQDETAPIDANTTIPANILHTQPIKAVSKVDGNAIVMSAVLGYDVGNFEYNWYGVVATKANNQQVLIAVVTTATQTKTKTVGPITGNYSVKSVLWRSQNIADQLNVTLSALPWQVQEGELVSRADFDAHNHDNLYAKLTDITNTLTSTAINKPLSANQGRVLKGLIDNINAVLSSDDTTLDELQEIVNFIKQNKATLNTLGVANIAGLQSALNAKQNALGYTPVQQGTGTNQRANKIKIGWGGQSKLLLEVDETNFGNTWPIISASASKLNGQSASYYAKASDVQPATTSSRGTVKKATGAEVVAGEVDKYPDAEGVKHGVTQIGKDLFVENDPKPIPDLSTPPNNSSFSFGYSGAHSAATEGDNPFPLDGGAFSLISTGAAFGGNGYVSQIAIGYRNSKAGQEIKVRGIAVNPADDCWVTLQHSHNLATQNDINNSVPDKAPSAGAVKYFVGTRLPKPAVKHYYTTSNITVDFSDAQRHVVTRYGTGNGTITLSGTVKAGDELVIVNVRDDSGTATITGKTMFTGVGGEGAATHTLTGQAKVTMFGFDGSDRLMIAEVV